MSASLSAAVEIQAREHVAELNGGFAPTTAEKPPKGELQNLRERALVPSSRDWFLLNWRASVIYMQSFELAARTRTHVHWP